MSVREKTIFGFFWALGGQFSVQAINIVVQVILARLLLPSQFGIIAMLSVFMAVGSTLMNSGLTSSLIRTQDADDRDYSTVFFLNLGASVLLYFLLFASAPVIAGFFKQPVLKGVVRIYTLSFIIQAFADVQVTRLTKAMNFKAQMLMQVPSVLVSGGLGILLAYKGFGVWSLVWMNLVQSFLYAGQHWIWTGWRPSLVIDLERLRRHFHFGSRLSASWIIDILYENSYNIIIGRLYPPAYLGYYNRAQAFQSIPVTNIGTVLNKVTYPLFASISDDDARLKVAYSKLMTQVLFWIAPAMALCIVAARPLFVVVLTDKWLPSVPYFQILCLTGVLYPLHVYNLNILMVKGRSDLFLKLEVIKKVVQTIGILAALPFGIIGLLYAQLAYSIAAFAINTAYSGRMIGYPARQQLLDILPILVTALVAGLLAKTLDDLVIGPSGCSNWIRLGVTGIFYLTAYLGISLAARLKPIFDFTQFLVKKELKFAP